MEIKTTNWGIAYRSKDCIEINPILLDYPKLLDKTIEHELNHTDSFIDLVDIKDMFKSQKEKLKFSMRHPIISLQSSLPVWYHNGEWCVNPNQVMFLSVIIGTSVLMLKFIIV